MTYAQAVQFLYDLRLFGAKFGLENTFKLAALAGHPQNQLRFIHVAGTNGKGSTCAMLESIYRAAGLRTGLFTSPHLVSFRERIQVNRQLISENEVVRLVEEIQPLLKQFPADHHPTFFEVVTVMALKFFAEQKSDLVIWETGLGGRLDATNVVTPLASVITNIAFEHQQWLGDTLEKIAAEKAGIIKPGVPVITAADEPEALKVIEEVARKQNAPLTMVNGRDVALRRPDSAARCPYLPLLGEHQKINAMLALAAVEVLQNKIPVSHEAIRTGLSKVNWPGRLQLVTRPLGQKLLLDGAHNVAGAKVLRAALEEHFKLAKHTLILGMLQDKDWRHICETLAPLAVRILTVPVSSERSADARELAAACRAVNPTAGIAACGSLREALEKAAGDDFVVITGSLYLVGEALELAGLSPANGGERALNEWTTKVSMR
ncbi:MAG: folylpolyglutamate synthase/dihydrofolate synthase family protein [Verrucomicrobiota bacterium]|jgi:dihydrofolate synthase/folylpolyglutamate synthase